MAGSGSRGGARSAQLSVATGRGEARVYIHLSRGSDAIGVVALGHGAGGGVGAPDLVAACEAAADAGFAVALVEQPYRVSGRKSPAPAAQLDEAWIDVISWLREGGAGIGGDGGLLIVGGRSAGARVACRTAAICGADGVLCLAFPLRPPRRSAQAPTKDRQDELDAVSVPVLVVQGTSDPFGMPAGGPTRTVVEVPGNHSLRTGLVEIGPAVSEWLASVAGARPVL